MKENVYAPYVNRCLGVARQLITTDTPNSFFESAYQDAAMLQLYYAWWHYTNEVLIRHYHEALSISVFELTHYFSECNLEIHEINSIKQLLQLKPSWLQEILSHPDVIANPDPINKKNKAGNSDVQANAIQLIDIEVNSPAQISSERVNQLINLTTDFIHQQRELSLEY